MLSIIIPCFNEEKTIKLIIEKIIYKSGFQDIEIIVVNDASTDNSEKILDDLKIKYTQIKKIIKHQKNMGKGASVRSAIKECNGDIILIQDADLEYDPSEYKKLIKPINEGYADVVYGSRFRGTEGIRMIYFWNAIANKFLTLLSNLLTGFNLTDMETCYKVFKAEILKGIDIKENRFGSEPEITAKISKLKCKVYEVGITYHGRTYEEGKKINWKDGIKAIYCIFRYNLFK